MKTLTTPQARQEAIDTIAALDYIDEYDAALSDWSRSIKPWYDVPAVTTAVGKAVRNGWMWRFSVTQAGLTHEGARVLFGWIAR